MSNRDKNTVKKNYAGLVYFIINIIIMLWAAKCYSQDGHPMSAMGEELLNMNRNISIGNACGVDNYFVTHVYGDLNMNGHTMQLLNAKIIIHGELINQGVIEFLCGEAWIEYDETLDVPDPVLLDPFEYKIYPNPATNYVNINGQGIETIQFYDMSGRLVKNYVTIAIRNQVYVNDLPDGIYIIKVFGSSDRQGTFKLIKK